MSEQRDSRISIRLLHVCENSVSCMYRPVSSIALDDFGRIFEREKIRKNISGGDIRRTDDKLELQSVTSYRYTVQSPTVTSWVV
jgi:hypothetical protein